jgi:hypothetical protein
MHKIVAFLILLILILSSFLLITTETVSAQKGVTTPLLTGFVITYDTFPVHHAPTYTVDPQTGTAIIDQPGYDTENRWLTIHIGNQLFEPYCDSNNNYITEFYDVRWKVHNSESWSYRPDSARATSQNTEFTSTAIGLGFKGFSTPSISPLLDYVSGQQLDFQIKASIGYFKSGLTFVGNSTDWSDTQTFTIPHDDTPSPKPTPTASTKPFHSNTPSTSTSPKVDVTPTQSSIGFEGMGGVFAFFVVLFAVIAVLLVFAVFYLRRRSIGGTNE